ncbi:hypothetical protein EMIHUDRAFT_62876 [Emiliania huxleyi CCMP1516]|uniref:Elongation factor P n=2 Tax=Emiliania huxleyi TaxID=2903 RepID=A0A0D3KQT0_EMIH1|nr:hypothetical protein EMIHUDRAFT_62876 [Emiliania huxleyi CCMP1516]EOD38115.1 hypothetical protein EMIHUDRAFT_62876 [Emiliania huxleyi CCMP1516]|eukprot:XP_005790544.1 hypothetical protein EMIHUDRAFT_62876 [Emiliania huxleyi CCMP1516]
MLVPGSEVSRQADRIFRVLSVGHVKPGKGGAFVQAKLKCVLDGTIVPHKFRSAETVETAEDYSLLYTDGGLVHLMHGETFEQIEVPREAFGELAVWLRDGMSVRVASRQGVPLLFTLPPRAAYEVVETRLGSREGKTDACGNLTARHPLRQVLSNGEALRVPHFVTVGDRILVNTEDGTYYGKAGPDEG